MSRSRSASLRVVSFLPLLIAMACAPENELPSGPAVQPSLVAANVAVPTANAFGPTEYVRTTASPRVESATFTADPAADYIIDIDDLATQGADGSVSVNGQVIPALRTATETGPRHLHQAIVLQERNALTVRLTGKPGSKLRVSILGGAKLVDANGGVVHLPGGTVELAIPSGALAGPTEIQLTPLPASAYRCADTQRLPLLRCQGHHWLRRCA